MMSPRFSSRSRQRVPYRTLTSYCGPGAATRSTERERGQKRNDALVDLGLKNFEKGTKKGGEDEQATEDSKHAFICTYVLGTES